MKHNLIGRGNHLSLVKHILHFSEVSWPTVINWWSIIVDLTDSFDYEWPLNIFVVCYCLYNIELFIVIRYSFAWCLVLWFQVKVCFSCFQKAKTFSRTWKVMNDKLLRMHVVETNWHFADLTRNSLLKLNYLFVSLFLAQTWPTETYLTHTHTPPYPVLCISLVQHDM